MHPTSVKAPLWCLFLFMNIYTPNNLHKKQRRLLVATRLQNKRLFIYEHIHPQQTQNNKNKKTKKKRRNENEKLYIRKTNNQLGEKDPL